MTDRSAFRVPRAASGDTRHLPVLGETAPASVSDDVPRGTRHAARTVLLRVSGIDCASCAAPITRALEALPGVSGVTVDVLQGEVRVAVEESAPSRDALERAIAGAGFAVRHEQRHLVRRPRGPLVAAAISGVALLAGLVVGWSSGPIVLARSLLGVALVAGGWYVLPRGVRAVRTGALDMHALMSLAAIGGVLVGEWGEAASAMFLFAVARLLEEWAVGRARGAITALMDLAPAEARLVTAAGERVVPVAQVAVGDRVRIRPGERVPVDGTIAAGSSALDESPITGESLPVDKAPGAAVYAGSINRHGALEVVSSTPAEDTTLARILHRVEEAQAARAPVQTQVDRFAMVYTPAVVVLAALVALLPPLVGLGAWTSWVTRGLTLLVIACPCALVISTPVTIVSALTGLARAGVLVKGGAQLEALAGVTAVAFDKTGTLTHGRPAVTDVVPVDGRGETELLRLAAAVERDSEHPVARAIVAAAADRGLALPDVAGFTALPGRGARAVVAGRPLILGNRRLCDETGACEDGVHALMASLEREGKTAMLLAEAQRPLGVLAVADRVRDEAAPAVAALQQAGARHIVMLTGDSEAVAASVARRVGVADVRARLLPEEKHAVVRELERQGERVLAVGDGVNDAPALAAASVGVAMGAAGTHVALETADVALMRDDLGALAPAIRSARSARTLIRQNIAFAVGVKLLFLGLAVAGQATLWMAVAADMGASLAVIANGLRALRGAQLEPVAGRSA